MPDLAMGLALCAGHPAGAGKEEGQRRRALWAALSFKAQRSRRGPGSRAGAHKLTCIVCVSVTRAPAESAHCLRVLYLVAKMRKGKSLRLSMSAAT